MDRLLKRINANPRRKSIEYKKVRYPRNADLGIDPFCYECTSHARNKDGYVKGIGRNMLMHRFLFNEVHGFFPEVVMHLCDNPACININHLKAGDCIENNLDKKNKGNAIGINSGESNHFSKLTEDQVRKIRRDIASGKTVKEVGIKFNITPQAVSKIKLNQRWRHVI